MDKKTIIITGGTSGIGKEAAISLAGKNACIILPARNMEKGEQVKTQIIDKTGNRNICLMKCDLSSFDSIATFADNFKEKFDKLDVLVNNAGIWETGKKKSIDGIELNFAVNHLGPFLLTNLLLNELRKGASARIINVSSNAHRWWNFNFNDPESKRSYFSLRSYGRSKLANILFTRHLADMVREDGIMVNCMHPGFVATNLFHNLPRVFRIMISPFMLSPCRGARTIIFLATSPDADGISGEYFVKDKLRKPSSVSLDRNSAEKLWQISREYTGI